MQPFDRDFSELQAETIPPEVAEEALRAFIIRVENDRPIPPALLRFIAKGLQGQREISDPKGYKWALKGWVKRPRGGQRKREFDYGKMLAWYRHELDEEYCALPLNNESDAGRRAVIAKSLTRDGFSYGDSSISVYRAVEWFYDSGLWGNDSACRTSIHDQIVTETFCRQYLQIEDRTEIYKKCQQIIARWKKGQC